MHAGSAVSYDSHFSLPAVSHRNKLWLAREQQADHESTFNIRNLIGPEMNVEEQADEGVAAPSGKPTGIQASHLKPRA